MTTMNETEARLFRCITMAMGCLDPDSPRTDEALAWFRLLDALEGREPRPALYDQGPNRPPVECQIRRGRAFSSTFNG